MKLRKNTYFFFSRLCQLKEEILGDRRPETKKKGGKEMGDKVKRLEKELQKEEDERDVYKYRKEAHDKKHGKETKKEEERDTGLPGE